MRRYMSAMLLGAVLCVPVALTAQEREHSVESRDRVEVKRYYDPYKKDYHEWNENENRAWNHWVTEERHGRMHDYAKARNREQRDYWKWRHEHPDWDRH